MMHIKISDCKLQDFDNIYILAQTLAHYFPKPEQFVTGIHELLVNAMEHGNLGLGFAAKTELIRQGKWKEEIAHRLSLPENATKEVEIKLSYNEFECRLTITDQGKGFPWKEFVGRPAGSALPNGRGLWIAFNSKFDHIIFNAAGNEVTCVAEYSHWSEASPKILRRA